MPKRSEPEPPTDGLSNDEIIAIVNDIRAIQARPKDRERTAAKRYPEFRERYPFLFDMVCGESFDYNRFQYMMALKANVDRSQITHEQASTKVGQDLYNVYVRDKVPDKKPPAAEDK